MGKSTVQIFWDALKSRTGVGAILLVLGLVGAMLYLRTDKAFQLVTAIVCIPYGSWVCISGIREKKDLD